MTALFGVTSRSTSSPPISSISRPAPRLASSLFVGPAEVMKENESKRQHWGESVKGRVSSDYKARGSDRSIGRASKEAPTLFRSEVARD